MKLRLHWAEKYEMVKKYPTFELDSEQFPELEMEMLQIHSAGSAHHRSEALDTLEYKMHHTIGGERGETIFQMVGPHNGLSDPQTYPVTEEKRSLVLTEEE